MTDLPSHPHFLHGGGAWGERKGYGSQLQKAHGSDDRAGEDAGSGDDKSIEA